MKENFLTIPDAPGYEISRQWRVRNKKTGAFLKTYMNHGCLMVRLMVGGVPTNRTLAMLRRQAVAAAAKHATWKPVPSLNGKYECNVTGKLRNTRTKREVKFLEKRKQYMVRLDGKAVNVPISQLMWEMHGIIPKKDYNPVGVTLSKGNVCKYFKSMSAAARYLAGVVYYAYKTIRDFFSKRRAEVEGWSVKYDEPRTLRI